MFLLEASGENPFPYVFRLLEASLAVFLDDDVLTSLQPLAFVTRPLPPILISFLLLIRTL